MYSALFLGKWSKVYIYIYMLCSFTSPSLQLKIKCERFDPGLGSHVHNPVLKALEVGPFLPLPPRSSPFLRFLHFLPTGENFFSYKFSPVGNIFFSPVG